PIDAVEVDPVPATEDWRRARGAEDARRAGRARRHQDRAQGGAPDVPEQILAAAEEPGRVRLLPLLAVLLVLLLVLAGEEVLLVRLLLVLAVLLVLLFLFTGEEVLLVRLLLV